MEYLIHYGVKGMRWGVRKKKDKTSSKKISKKQYKKIVKENKKVLQNNKQQWLKAYSEGDIKTSKILEANNRIAVKNINDARVKRGKKRVKSIMYNLPGTFVGRNYV